MYCVSTHDIQKLLAEPMLVKQFRIFFFLLNEQAGGTIWNLATSDNKHSYDNKFGQSLRYALETTHATPS